MVEDWFISKHEHLGEAYLKRFYDEEFYLDLADQIMGLCDGKELGNEYDDVIDDFVIDYK